MDLQFDSLSPEEAAVSNAKVIITTQDEAGIVNKRGIVMIDTELEKYPAIAKAKILRSVVGERVIDDQLIIGIDPGSRIGISAIYLHHEIASAVVESSPQDAINHVAVMRSEEHTSELQSRQYLVCRLLLEKKKNSNRIVS